MVGIEFGRFLYEVGFWSSPGYPPGSLFETILELIFGSFRDFEVFVSFFFGIMIFDHFGDPICMVLRFIFDVFFDVFFIFSYMQAWQPKMWFGFILY